MIHIIEGRIGSGKTYWCVSYILRQFYEWDNRYFSYFPKKEIPIIITNIRGLNIGSVVDLNLLLDKAGSLENLFFIDPITYKLRYDIFRNAIIMVDEAQSPRFFHRLYKSPSVMLFFQLHRHFGAEIFFTTQDVKTLCPDLRELPEYHLRCVRQSLLLGNYFTYRKYYDSEKGATTRFKKDKRIFDSYASSESGVQHKSVKSALTRYVYLMVICVCLFLLGGYFMKSYFFSGNKSKIFSQSKVSMVGKASASGTKSTPIYGLTPLSISKTVSSSQVNSNINGVGIYSLDYLLLRGYVRVQVFTNNHTWREIEYQGLLYSFIDNKLSKIKQLANDRANEGMNKLL